MNRTEMDLAIADNMKKYGGSFVEALAEAFLRADPFNKIKLRDTFPDIFSQYHPSNWVKQNQEGK
jgi:hypothetical protein